MNHASVLPPSPATVAEGVVTAVCDGCNKNGAKDPGGDIDG